jgi:polar amino acid transport system substrate-binding protein
MHSDIVPAFAPTGVLRASINVGNPILARRAEGGAVGVSVDLAQGLAHRLGVALELHVFDTAAQSVDAVAGGQADVGFFAIDPKRGAAIAFTPPYVLIEGCYMVRHDSPLHANEEVDAPGRRIAVGDGSAYDLYLTREIRHATLVRAHGSAAVVETFLAQGLEVAAGIKQQLQAEAQQRGGLRLLPGRFMVIRQAMGLARARGDAAAAFLAAFVEEKKASGEVAAALDRHGIAGAAVAPAGA